MTRSRWNLLLCVSLFVLSEASIRQCEAGLIAFDSFDYAVGTLSGNGGAADGWTGAWDGATQTVVSPGLTYTDSLGNNLVTAGNRVRPDFGTRSSRFLDLSAGGNAGLAGVIDAGSGKIGKDGTAIWIAFLAQGPSATPPADQNFLWAGIDLYDGAFGDDGNLFLGKTAGSEFEWGIGGQVVGANLNSTIPTTQQVLFVAQIEFAVGADTLRVWLNPNLDAPPSPGDAAITQTTMFDLKFDRIRIAGSDQFSFDELRVGTSFGNVAPTPEPSSLALLALGGLSLLGYRTRRSSRIAAA